MATADDVLDIIINNIREVFPALEHQPIGADVSMQALGLNSIDRSEVVMMTLETCELAEPMITFAAANNIGELARLIHSKL